MSPRLYFPVFALFLLVTPPLSAQHAIIPAPVRAAIQMGAFHIDAETAVLYDTDSADVRAVAEYLASRIGRVSSFTPAVRYYTGTSLPRGSILLSIRTAEGEVHPEGYALRVAPNGARCTAQSAAGLFYGVQTFRQLLPPRFESVAGRDTVRGWDAKCCLIVDAPRFTWRGLMLDCARHFLDVDFIRHTIDVMALLKMNRLHWHLTDDQGWRLEIRRYPALTAVGAWRREADGSRYGGFYTQEQVRDIVDYAAARHITVVPEIEMPGHARAALAAYPALSCTQESLPVPHTWGVFEDVFCAGKDETVSFLQDVLTEVIDLFPSREIHLGGDEVPPHRWQECADCRARMQREGLTGASALQGWFMSRMATYLAARGRRMIGWDEILDGGLPDGAVVQSWRGMDGAVAATRAGHDAIVSPTSHAYFDYALRTTDLEQVYSFEPVPVALKSAEAARILGGEAAMWTERAPQSVIEEKIHPRLLAMAEVLWTPPLQRNFFLFRRRVQEYYPRLDSLGVRYGFEAPPVRFVAAHDSSAAGLSVSLKAGQPGLQLQALRFGPDGTAREVDVPVALQGRGMLGAVARKNARLHSDTAQLCYDVHDALFARVHYSRAASRHYPGSGDSTLVDGICGSTDHHDGRWQGFPGGEVVLNIDLGEERTLQELSVGCLQYSAAWILPPRSVTFGVSRDGAAYTELSTVPLRQDEQDMTRQRVAFSVDVGGMRARYLRVRCDAQEVLPEGHPAAGREAWLFLDEISVR
jgi:hexosaminidase